MQLQEKLQEEMFQREAHREAQSTLETLRQDSGNVYLEIFDLECKVDSLQEEIDFLKKLHCDETYEL